MKCLALITTPYSDCYSLLLQSAGVALCLYGIITNHNWTNLALLLLASPGVQSASILSFKSCCYYSTGEGVGGQPKLLIPCPWYKHMTHEVGLMYVCVTTCPYSSRAYPWSIILSTTM